jgi:hypothetical protein
MFDLRRIFFACALIILAAPSFAQAQLTSGIGLKPSLIEEGADPGQVLNRSISVTNLSDSEQTYYLFTRDISTVRDGGTPVYAEEGTERTGFELTEWLTLGIDEVTMSPGQETVIPVTIAVPDSATPGSHFGAVFISMQPPRLREVGASVGYEVANIISIRISGDVTESAQIRSFRTNKLVYGSTNIDFMAEVENKGNVLVRPYGPLTVHNMFGKQVASLTINESQGGVFPFTQRDFVLTWEDEGLGFGRYQAVVAMIYGDVGRQATISSTVSFWILPMKIITPALIILAILLLTAYFGVRMYVRRTISTLSGGRKLVRQRRSRNTGTSTLLMVAIVMLVVTALFLIVLLALFA